MRRSSILVVLTLAAAVAAGPAAQAKVSCSGTHPAADIPLEGLPAEPAAGAEYQVSVDVPRARPSNMWPIAMFLNCRDPYSDPSFNVNLPGAGDVGFTLRFTEPGRWRATLMDRGGTFHSLGTFDVQPAMAAAGESHAGAATPAADDGGDGAAAILAGLGLLGAAGATAAWSRVHRRRRGHLRQFGPHGGNNVPS